MIAVQDSLIISAMLLDGIQLPYLELPWSAHKLPILNLRDFLGAPFSFFNFLSSSCTVLGKVLGGIRNYINVVQDPGKT